MVGWIAHRKVFDRGPMLQIPMILGIYFDTKSSFQARFCFSSVLGENALLPKEIVNALGACELVLDPFDGREHGFC